MLRLRPHVRAAVAYEALEPYHVTFGRGGVELVDGEIERGFRLPEAKVVVFAEEQLFPRRTPRRPARDRLSALDCARSRSRRRHRMPGT